MKHRLTSLIAVFALCLGLCPTRALAADAAALANNDSEIQRNPEMTLKKDETPQSAHVITSEYILDVCEYSLEASKSTAIIVQSGGALHLKSGEHGSVTSKKGFGIQVNSGGSLIVEDPVTVSGSTYGLTVASGATVKLSGGTFSGGTAAIQAANNNFAALLAGGCAYFDADGSPMLSKDVAPAKTVTVKQCTDHPGKTYTHSSGAPTHSWSCPYCKEVVSSEKCTFNFGADGRATCTDCGRTISIAIDTSNLGDLIYNSQEQTANVTLTVTLDGGTVLVKDTDYTVCCTKRADVGEITVTVTGITYNGTFTKTYSISQAQPVIAWAETEKAVDYSGSQVKPTDLPGVTITAPDADDLSSQIQYSYRKTGDTDFTDGLPTNAGTYEIKASLPESQNYKAAETDPCLKLTINKIDALKTAPTAAQPTYNQQAQELVTPGGLDSRAVGAVIEYATSQNGPYSTDIPTGTNAGNYEVWYRVTGTDNYNGALVKVDNVKINPKNITPTVEVSPSSFVFDGLSKKSEVTVTVRDGNTVLDGDQYSVNWGNTDWTSAGDHTVTVSQVNNKNYTFNNKTAAVKIISATQSGLTITGKRDAVYYGDSIQLSAVGGTGEGSVTWKISSGPSTISAAGLLEVKGMGTLTVTAERTVDNYDKVTDTWTFDVKPKPVTAVVTVEDKAYDSGNAAGTITANVKDSDLVNSGDKVTITGLTGNFSDPNAGTNKTVTLDLTGANVTEGADKYTVSYPAAATGTITPKAVTVTLTLTDEDLLTDGTTKYYEYDGAAKKPAVTVTYTGADNILVPVPASNYDVSYSSNKNVGTNATVTVTAKAGGNFTFDNAQPITATFEIRKAQAVLTGSPQAKDLTYTGAAQELVTVGTATGGTVVYSEALNGTYLEAIPSQLNAGTYTVYYKVQGDGNHADTAAKSVQVTIKPKNITPAITLNPTSYIYDGTAKMPTKVTVKDDTKDIPTSEYAVSYRDNTNAGTATVIVSNKNGGNYIVNGTATFTITKAGAAFAPKPEGRANLPYNGAAQELVTAGSSNHGTVVYSLNQAGPYSTQIPTGTAVQSYTVWYKVLGDQNHNDTTPNSTAASIVTNSVTNPTVELSSSKFTFNGSEQKPTVTLKDDSGKIIPADEYTVKYGIDGESTINQGTYTITITSKGSNYSFTEQTRTVTILAADQTALTITGKPNVVYYGDTIQLGTTGGTGNGTVEWDVVSGSAEKGLNQGQFTITGSGNIKIKASRTSTSGNYEVAEDTWEFFAYPKPVDVDVTVASDSYVYTGSAITPGVTVTVNGTPITNSDYDVTYDNNTNVGTASVTVKQKDGGKYAFSPVTKNFTITQATTVVTAPTAKGPLTQTENAQELVNAGSTNFGKLLLLYSLSEDGEYSSAIPTATKAGTYTVYYKVEETDNYTGVTGGPITVTINAATGGGETGGGDETGGDETGSGETGGTPSPSEAPSASTTPTTKTEDKETGTVTETTTQPDGSSVTKVTQKDGTTATVSTSAEGTVEAKVELPAAVVNDAREKGETITLPIPEVKVTRSADTAPTVTVNTGSEGEVTVEIPTADVTPGTVAVLVKADGTEEVIKTSVPTENGLAVSLPDGATVKLVDNSKDFADVPADGRQADIVAFASARELFKGTSATTFAPEEPMTRAMMTTVLARLAGVDTDGGATWYEKGQEWAAENGISNGSDPNGSITREQLAVMLWRYAGCPDADDKALDFTDADKASNYAVEALRWATEKGIMGGTDDGLLDPAGTATRAEAAQILRDFIEKT